MDRNAQRARLLLMAFDGALTLALILAFGLLTAGDPFHYPARHPEVLLLPGFFILFLYIGDLYDVRRRRPSRYLLVKAAVMTCMAAVFFYSFHAVTSSHAGIEGMPVSLSFGMALGVTFVRGAFLPRLREHTPYEKAIVFGGGWGGCEVLDCLKRSPWGGIRPVGIIDDNPAKRNFVYRDIPVIGTRDSLREAVKLHDVGIVINAAPQVGSDELVKALSNGGPAKVRVIDLEKFYEQATGKLLLQEKEGHWRVREGRIEADPRHALGSAKRVQDVGCALATFLLAAPLFALVAVLLKTLSRKPALAEEEMVGLGGRPFYRLSFRTNGEARFPWASRLLAALEKGLVMTRLRELPMVLNVLRGDMSFFGPVPESPAFVEAAQKRNPLYGLRQQVRPGLIGWAEVNLFGRNYPADHVERLGYDLYYVKNVSSRLDLRILAGLFKTVLLSPERL